MESVRFSMEKSQFFAQQVTFIPNFTTIHAILANT